jgi:quinol monooxygenase YgiN
MIFLQGGIPEKKGIASLPWSVMIFDMNSTKTITVIAILKAQPGKEAVVKQELLALIAPTRKEPGCINYDLHEDMENPARFVFHENWASMTELEAHLERPHLKALMAKAGELLAEPPQLIMAAKIG